MAGPRLIRLFVAVLIMTVLLPSPAQAGVVQGGTDTPMICGTWTYYAPRVMQRVRETRGMAPCGECAGMAATVNQAHIGRRIEVWFAGAWRGVFQVVDVGNGHNRAGLVGEVDYATAQRWGRAGPWWGCYRIVS